MNIVSKIQVVILWCEHTSGEWCIYGVLVRIFQTSFVFLGKYKAVNYHKDITLSQDFARQNTEQRNTDFLKTD